MERTSCRSLSLRTDQILRLDRIAQKTNRSVSTLVRDAIALWLREVEDGEA